MKLDITVGILSWKKRNVLKNTLDSYVSAGLFDFVKETIIVFQEAEKEDVEIAEQYKLENAIFLNRNIGIGAAFNKIADHSTANNLLFLENDWVFNQYPSLGYEAIKEAIELSDSKNVPFLRMRNRFHPGCPLFTAQFMHNEDQMGEHLLDSIHWLEPHERFPDKFSKDGNFILTSTKYGNYTNNPAVINKEFYLKTIAPNKGEGIDLEGNMKSVWQNLDIQVAHHIQGIFTHLDFEKYKQ